MFLTTVMHIISVTAQIMLENALFCRQKGRLKNCLFCSKFCSKFKPSDVTIWLKINTPVVNHGSCMHNDMDLAIFCSSNESAEVF